MEVREKILNILGRRGPSLPVHVAKETGLSILFASAFLSELLAEKEIRISYMRVGSSPIYFLNNHENMLERYSQHLKSREKDAYILLKEKRFLKDSEQTPAIRVALRSIKDFAIPIIKDGEIFWRYYLIPENEFPRMPAVEINNPLKEPLKEIEMVTPVSMPSESAQEEIKEIIIAGPIAEPEKKKTSKERQPKEVKAVSRQKSKKPRKKMEKKDDKFFNKVKDWLTSNSMEIIDIQDFNKNGLRLRIRGKEGEEQFLFAYNKKKISDLDIIKAGKKATEHNLGYFILSLGESPKKITELTNASKNLIGIKNINTSFKN